MRRALARGVLCRGGPNAGEIVVIASDFYQGPSQASVPVLRLSYDDCTGIFPWDDGYSCPEMHPRPGRFRHEGFARRTSQFPRRTG